MRSRAQEGTGQPRRIAVCLLALVVMGGVGERPAVADAQRPITLAVLNLANRSPGSVWDWLEKGLADMLITDLSRTPRLQVLCRERMQMLLEELALGRDALVRAETGQHVGRIAAVEQVVFGSFWIRGGMLTIELHVVDTGTGRLVRVEQVSGPAKDVMQLEKRLAAELLSRLSVPLTEAERQRLAAVPPLDLPAARSFYTAIGLYDEGEYLDALGLLRHACRAAPEHADSLFWCGRLYQLAGEPEHALLRYGHLLRRFPHDRFAPDALFHTAQACSELRQAERAIAAWRALAEQHPNARLSLGIASDGTAFILADRQLFASPEGATWRHVGTVGPPVPEGPRGTEGWYGACFLEVRPKTFWLLARPSIGPCRAYESQDLVHWRLATELPRDVEWPTLVRDREGHIWLFWRGWCTRTCEPGWPKGSAERSQGNDTEGQGGR